MADFFWITNISKRIVGLSDLGIYLQPFTSVNLLDRKHYHFTPEQIKKSATCGSLFAKKHMIVIRQVPPNPEKNRLLPVDEKPSVPSRKRSSVEVEYVKYEELEISDDDFARDNADTAQQDHL